MPIYTQKEYDEKESGPVVDNKGTVEEKGSTLPEERISKPVTVIQYWFLHPEIPKFGVPPSFEGELKLEGKVFFRKCIRGIIKTHEKPLVDFLKKKGYIVMHKENIEIDNSNG
jgi:hypothetical protein